MEIEKDIERIAFNYVCELAFERTNKKVCNDLPEKLIEKFKKETVKSIDADGNKLSREIIYDYDIICWLRWETKY